MITDTLANEFANDPTDNLNEIVVIGELTDSSSDAESDISISEKIVLDSTEKRLRHRITSLQSSIRDLKEQLKLEKRLWKEDMEKIRNLQKQKQDMNCNCCLMQPKSKEVKKEKSTSSFGGDINSLSQQELLNQHSIKRLLEFQHYKRKIAETENMCNLELLKVKQSLDDLKTLQTIATQWGKQENDQNSNMKCKEQLEEIFVNSCAKSE